MCVKETKNMEIWNVSFWGWEFDSRIYKHVADDDYSETDWSNYSFPNDMWEHKPYWELAVKLWVIVPIIICGIFGNTVLFSLVIRNRPMRSATNILMANLFIADLVTLIICPWMVICKDFFQNYILGEFGCKSETFIISTLLLTDVFGLCAVSYDRLTAIVLPHRARMNRRSSLIVALASWTAGTLFSLPFVLFHYYKERQWKNFLEIYCKEESKILPVYWNVVITLLIWLPLGVTSICYISIFIKLERYEQRVLRREHPICVNYKTKVSRMVFIIVISTIICRLPFSIMQFIRNQFLDANKMNQADDSFRILWIVSHYLIFISSALTPFIYGLSNEKMRRSLRLVYLTRLRQTFCMKARSNSGPRFTLQRFLSKRNQRKEDTLGSNDERNNQTRRALEPREACLLPQNEDQVNNTEKFRTLTTDTYM